MNSVVTRTIDPDRQVPLLDQLSDPARQLIARAEDVAGDWIVTATEIAPDVMAEVIDLGVMVPAAGGRYRLTARGAAVWLFVPHPRR